MNSTTVALARFLEKLNRLGSSPARLTLFFLFYQTPESFSESPLAIVSRVKSKLVCEYMIKTDRRTERQTGRQTTDRKTDRHKDTQRRQAGKQAGRQTDDGQTKTQTDRPTDRQTDDIHIIL